MKVFRGRGGFTLVELMAALVVLSIGLIGLMRMQMSSIQGNAFGGRMSTAIALGQDQMENLISQDLNPWPAGPVTGTQADPTLMGRQYEDYTVTWTITPDSPILNVATLDVQVQWPGGQNPVHLVCMKKR